MGAHLLLQGWGTDGHSGKSPQEDVDALRKATQVPARGIANLFSMHVHFHNVLHFPWVRRAFGLCHEA